MTLPPILSIEQRRQILNLPPTFQTHDLLLAEMSFLDSVELVPPPQEEASTAGPLRIMAWNAERRITDRTRVIMPVHMLPQTDRILDRAMLLSVGVVDPTLGAGYGINILSSDEEIDCTAEAFVKTVKKVLGQTRSKKVKEN